MSTHPNPSDPSARRAPRRGVATLLLAALAALALLAGPAAFADDACDDRCGQKEDACYDRCESAKDPSACEEKCDEAAAACYEACGD